MIFDANTIFVNKYVINLDVSSYKINNDGTQILENSHHANGVHI